MSYNWVPERSTLLGVFLLPILFWRHQRDDKPVSSLVTLGLPVNDNGRSGESWSLRLVRGPIAFRWEVHRLAGDDADGTDGVLHSVFLINGKSLQSAYDSSGDCDLR